MGSHGDMAARDDGHVAIEATFLLYRLGRDEELATIDTTTGRIEHAERLPRGGLDASARVERRLGPGVDARRVRDALLRAESGDAERAEREEDDDRGKMTSRDEPARLE